MKIAPYYPYKSEAARELYLAHYEALAAAEWPLASEERLAHTSYGDTFVRVSGPVGAPPLVLLPGACATSIMWAPNIVTLSKSCRTYAVDRVSEVGGSTTTRPLRRAEDLVAWMDELFNALNLDRPSLAGMSYGGWLAALYAHHLGERLSTAILLAPGGGIVGVSVKFLARLGLRTATFKLNFPSVMRWLFADLVRQDPQLFDSIVERSQIAMAALAKHTFVMPSRLSDDDLKNLRVRTLFLVGEHEQIYSPQKAVRRLNKLAPQVSTQIIPGAGHDLTIVQAEMVSRLMVDFVLKGAAPGVTTAARLG